MDWQCLFCFVWRSIPRQSCTSFSSCLCNEPETEPRFRNCGEVSGTMILHHLQPSSSSFLAQCHVSRRTACWLSTLMDNDCFSLFSYTLKASYRPCFHDRWEPNATSSEHAFLHCNTTCLQTERSVLVRLTDWLARPLFVKEKKEK